MPRKSSSIAFVLWIGVMQGVAQESDNFDQPPIPPKAAAAAGQGIKWSPASCADALFGEDKILDGRYWAQRSMGSGFWVLDSKERARASHIAIIDSSHVPYTPIFQDLFAESPSYDDTEVIPARRTHVQNVMALFCSQSTCSLSPIEGTQLSYQGALDGVDSGDFYQYDNFIMQQLRNILTYNQTHDAKIRVVNISLRNYLPMHKKATQDFLAQIQSQDDAVIVWAAGNGFGESIPFGDMTAPIVPVSGIFPGGELPSPQSDSGAWTMFAAPSDFVSATSDALYFSGTSYAAPLVSGVFHVLFKVNPTLTAKQAISLLSKTAFDVGAPGRDTRFGYGVPNGVLAVAVDKVLTQAAHMESEKGQMGIDDVKQQITHAIQTGKVSSLLLPALADYQSAMEATELAHAHIIQNVSTCEAYQQEVVKLFVRYFLSGGTEETRKELCAFYQYHFPNEEKYTLGFDLVQYCPKDETLLEMFLERKMDFLDFLAYMVLFAHPKMIQMPLWDAYMDTFISEEVVAEMSADVKGMVIPNVAYIVLSQPEAIAHAKWPQWIDTLLPLFPQEIAKSVFSQEKALEQAGDKLPKWLSHVMTAEVGKDSQVSEKELVLPRYVLSRTWAIQNDLYWKERMHVYLLADTFSNFWPLLTAEAMKRPDWSELMRVLIVAGPKDAAFWVLRDPEVMKHPQWISLMKYLVLTVIQSPDVSDQKWFADALQLVFLDEYVSEQPQFGDFMRELVLEGEPYWVSVVGSDAKVSVAALVLGLARTVMHPEWEAWMHQLIMHRPHEAKWLLKNNSTVQVHPKYPELLASLPK